ncbi:TPA: AraC family transcriptional regulator [Burkholderia lata]
MDPLSEVLGQLHPVSATSVALDAGGAWALSLAGKKNSLKFFAVQKGECWLSTEGGSPQRLVVGDCVLLTKGLVYILGSCPDVPPVVTEPQLEHCQSYVMTINGGGDHLIVSCNFDLADNDAVRVLDPLPDIVHMPREESQATVLPGALQRLALDLQSPRLGTELMVAHLSHLMLLEMLRLFFSSDRSELPPGWLLAMSDPRVAATIRAMHNDPGRAWKLSELAAAGAMSRTVLASRFKQLMGISPMEYLTRWRLLTAATKLRSTSIPISKIATEVGYASEYSFITAFTRAMGMPPGAYRRYTKGTATDMA